MEPISIARAVVAEEAACLAMMPASRRPDAVLLIARAGTSLAGAAALHWCERPVKPGFALDVGVMPAFRRRGVGRQLVAAALRCAAGETEALWSLQPLLPDDPASLFARACGFTAGEQVFRYRVETRRLNAQTEAIVTRLRRHGRIPPEGRAVPLRDVSLPQVAILAARTLALPFGAAMELLTHRVDLDLSVAVLVGDELAGAIFGDWRSGECRIEANLVAPAWRGSFANALLLAQSTRNILDAGWESFTFGAREGAADTIGLARRAGGERLATRAYYRHAVASA